MLLYVWQVPCLIVMASSGTVVCWELKACVGILFSIVFGSNSCAAYHNKSCTKSHYSHRHSAPFLAPLIAHSLPACWAAIPMMPSILSFPPPSWALSCLPSPWLLCVATLACRPGARRMTFTRHTAGHCGLCCQVMSGSTNLLWHGCVCFGIEMQLQDGDLSSTTDEAGSHVYICGRVHAMELVLRPLN